MSTSAVERSAATRVLTYATCVFAVLAWPFVPYVAAAASLVCIGLLAARTPSSALERWALHIVATLAFIASIVVWFATPVGM